MTSLPVAVDIDAAPDLAALVDEVQRTRRTYILKRGEKEVAILRPVGALARPRPGKRRRRYPTVASVVGAAGTLARPMSWDELRTLVRDERADAYRAKRDE